MTQLMGVPPQRELSEYQNYRRRNSLFALAAKLVLP
jgi:hypothetical protein